MLHRFPDFEIDEELRELRCKGRVLPLQPRVFDLLVHLARHRTRVVSKDELLEQVWPGVIVADGSLQRAISLARAALEEAGAAEAIRTYPKQGYRLCVEPVAVRAPAPPVEPGPLRQEIRYVRSADGTSLAYAISGSGRPLIKAANWLGHLEFDQASPIWRHWWRELGARFRLIRYDERGSGLSQRDVDAFTLPAWVADLEAVADAAERGPFALLGISQGAAVAIEYAIRHPERVSHLVLYGGFAQGRMKRRTSLRERKEAVMLARLIRLGWGRENSAFSRIFASLFMPEGTADDHRHFVELQRVSCSPESAERFVRTFGVLDVADKLRQVRVPTLVLHARDDREIPVEQARLFASAIPDSRLVLLDSCNHILGEREPAWPRFLEELAQFLR